MSNQEVSPHVFFTADAGHPGVTAVSAKLIFPSPFTLGDYKRWYRALMPDLDDKESADNDSLLREYKAAMSVAALEEIMPEGDVIPDPENVDAFNLRDVVLMDGNVPDTLPISFATWVCECAEECFGHHVSLEGRQAKIARLSRVKLESPTIGADHEMLTRLLPDLAGYSGSVTFVKSVTKMVYAKWLKALRPLPAVSPIDIDNSLFMREYRAALELVAEWKIDDVPFKVMKHKDGETAPLIMASFLVLAAEMYLSKTMPLKKMPALSGGI